MDNIFTDGTLIYIQRNHSLLLLSGADPKTFQPLMYTFFDDYEYPIQNYYQDKKNLYRNNIPLQNINRKKFRLITRGSYYDKVTYTTDETRVYANGNLIP